MAYILLNIVEDCAVPGRVCLYLKEKENVRGLRPVWNFHCRLFNEHLQTIGGFPVSCHECKQAQREALELLGKKGAKNE